MQLNLSSSRHAIGRSAAPVAAPSAAPAPVADIEELHRAACAARHAFYTDPTTGLCVFTAYQLAKRPCCGCGCRHCPYRASRTRSGAGVRVGARMLHGNWEDVDEEVDVLFWSGGKDSYLAMRAMKREGAREVVLLTTYEGESGRVAHQEVGIEEVVQQAKVLEMPLVGVPLGYGEYVESVSRALDKLRDGGVEVKRLAFGDLHLRHIREWRDGHFGGLGALLHYPLWGVDYEALLRELEEEGVTVCVSAVDEDMCGKGVVKQGDLFTRAFVEALPVGVDRFGENGEFHTLVKVVGNSVKKKNMRRW